LVYQSDDTDTLNLLKVLLKPTQQPVSTSWE